MYGVTPKGKATTKQFDYLILDNSDSGRLAIRRFVLVVTGSL